MAESPTEHNPTPNTRSAWDANWQENFDGCDDPEQRRGYLRTRFTRSRLLRAVRGAGPFEVDRWQYVFGDEAPWPNHNGGAAIDLAPAVRDFLQLTSGASVEWRFVGAGGMAEII